MIDYLKNYLGTTKINTNILIYQIAKYLKLFILHYQAETILHLE